MNKGAYGFLTFSKLERITHEAESLLCQLRDSKRILAPALVSLSLETVDTTRKVLASIEASGEEGSIRFEGLIERLRIAAELKDDVENQAASEEPFLSPSRSPRSEPPVDKRSTAHHEVGQILKDAGVRYREKGEGRWDGVERRKLGATKDEDCEWS